MALAIITIYTSKCAQMDLQQLLKTSKFYSRCKQCDTEKTLRGWIPPPLVAQTLSSTILVLIFQENYSLRLWKVL